MSNLLGNSAMPNYVKLTATAILGATYLAALVVATYDMMVNMQVPNVVTFIMGTGLSMALGILGLHQGASLAEGAPQHPQLPQLPQLPQTPQTPQEVTTNASSSAA